MVALVVGKVMVVASVPARVRVLLAVRVLPSAMVKVALVAGAVMVTLLIEVAEATPRLGVVKTGEVKVLLVSVCVPPTVTTEAVFVPAVVTRKSPVPTVRIPAEWVATQSVLAKCRVPPEARYKSDQPSAVVPRVAVSFVAGLAEVVKVEAPATARVLPRVVAPVMLAVPATVRRDPGVVVPMPTLPCMINPPVGAAVPAYPIPTLAPPANALSPKTDSLLTGLVVPMPTLPEEGGSIMKLLALVV